MPFCSNRTIFCLCIISLLLAAVSLPALADPKLPYLITDHVVFQQGRPIHIWGSADSGERVTVSLAGHQAQATAGTDRKWNVELPAMTAGGPYTLTVAGRQTLTIKDVLIGEVWVASGQSNMTFELRSATGGAEETARADYPQIRLFTVPKRIAVEPQAETLPTSWQVCTPDSAKNFSAVAYFFARELHRRLGVPIGIIESAWPGTAIEEWMAPNSFNSDPDLHIALEQWQKESGAVRDFAATPKSFDLEFRNFELLRDNAALPVPFSNFFSDKQHSLHWSYDFTTAPQTTFQITDGVAHVSGLLDNSGLSLLSGRWNSNGTPVDLSAYLGIRFWVRGDGKFRVRFIEPTITDWDDYATDLIVATPEWKQVTISFRDLHQEGWGVVKEFTPAAQTGLAIESVTSLGFPPRPPAGLFDGMIAPLTSFPVRGALWYQGEGNALRAHLYRKQLPALIENWRKQWDDSSFPFLIVELPNHGAVPQQPAESAWAELREAEFMAYKHVPNVGLAVTIDVGEADNVHPSRKKEVGERLALWALGTTYQQQIEYSGPLYESATTEGNGMRIRFQHARGLKSADGKIVSGFAIAGADRKFHWANAVIDRDTVVVSSSEVAHPVAVRYAWGDNPRCNLVNGEGLPASPFRTDDWPGITQEVANK